MTEYNEILDVLLYAQSIHEASHRDETQTYSSANRQVKFWFTVYDTFHSDRGSLGKHEMEVE